MLLLKRLYNATIQHSWDYSVPVFLMGAVIGAVSGSPLLFGTIWVWSFCRWLYDSHQYSKVHIVENVYSRGTPGGKWDLGCAGYIDGNAIKSLLTQSWCLHSYRVQASKNHFGIGFANKVKRHAL